MNSLKSMIVFILAGGYGTRLKSEIKNLPKPLAPIKNKPFLSYQIDLLNKSFDSPKIYVLSYFMADKIQNYLKHYDNASCIVEPEKLGTGGSIKHAIKTLNLQTRNSILVLNGDSYTDYNLSNICKDGTEDINMLLSYQNDCSRYGTVGLVESNIHSFIEKKDGIKNAYINAGVYYFKTLSFFEKINETKFSLEEEFKNHLTHSTIKGIKHNGKFIDIGIPQDYKRSESIILK